jgi:hypothetical protein
MNIDVTDEQRRQIEAHSACVVKGSWCVTKPADPPHFGSPHAVSEFVIPQPWLDATKPCETCDGSGCDIDFCLSCGDEYTDPCDRHADRVHVTTGDSCCLNCRDGHPIVEFRGQCEVCLRTDGGGCSQCDFSGRVSLGRYAVELLPVAGRSWRQRRFVDVLANGSCVVRRTADPTYASTWEPLGSFDPLPVPGSDTVAVVTKVDQ